MNNYEKFGLIILIYFFTEIFPESWKGAEVGFFFAGCFLFFGGKLIKEFVDYK
ncbi:MAG: hypothetical protein WA061_01980 [Microgenomates group bacterium]